MTLSLDNLFFSGLAALGLYLVVSGLLSRRTSGGLAKGLGEPERPDLTLSDYPLPLGQRALAQPLADLGARLSRDDPADLEDRLRRSGWRYRSAGDYYGSKMLGAVALFVVAALVGVMLRLPLLVTVAFAAGAGGLGLVSPDIEIRKVTEIRRQALYREMAWTVDRLAVVMETGQGLDTALGTLLWISKGRGGLFMALLRDLANALGTHQTDVPQMLERLRRNAPRLAELDQFLQLVNVNLSRVQAIVPELKSLGSYMRDELTNRIEESRQKAELKVTFITTTVVIPALLIVIGGPALLSFLRFIP